MPVSAQIKTYKYLIEVAKQGDRHKLIATIEGLIAAKVTKTRAPTLDIVTPFEEFWLLYPKRDGGNPRKPAEKSFRVRLQQGADPQDIIAGVRRFAAVERKRVGTVFIPMAVTWLNQERWRDYLNGHPIDPTKPNQPPDPKEARRLQVIEEIRGHFA
jgi:hypothetical protein